MTTDTQIKEAINKLATIWFTKSGYQNEDLPLAYDDIVTLIKSEIRTAREEERAYIGNIKREAYQGGFKEGREEAMEKVEKLLADEELIVNRFSGRIVNENTIGRNQLRSELRIQLESLKGNATISNDDKFSYSPARKWKTKESTDKINIALSKGSYEKSIS